MRPIEKAKNWVQQEIGEAVHSMKRLSGSTSSLLYEVKTEDSTIILRQFDNEEWLLEEPDLVRHEAASLRKASDSGLPAPALIGFDETGGLSGLPSILMTKVEGKVELLPDNFNEWTDGLAKALVQIHQVKANDFPWKYAPYTKREAVRLPKWAKKTDVWQAALDCLHRIEPELCETLIHRDYHPANVLWIEKEVSGIVDWPNACRGPAGIDVGHCRVNLALLHSVEVADLFLQAYQRHAEPSFSYEPYWDIVSVFDFLDGPPVVYSGWAAFGVTGLTDEMMEVRLDQYLESIIDRR